MDSGGRVDLDRVAAVALAGLAVTVPLATSSILVEEHPRAFDSTEWVAVDLFDVFLLALLVSWIGRDGPRRLLVNSARLPRYLARAGLGLAVLSLVVHPSWHGLEMLLRGLGAVATIDAAARLETRHRIWFLTALVITGVCQAALGIAQSIRGEKFAVEVLEYRYRLFPFGGDVAGQGGFFHPYLLATYLLVAIGAALLLFVGRRQPALLAAAAVMAGGVAITFSRSALLGMIAGVGGLLVYGVRRHRSMVAFAMALCLGLAIGGLVGIDGWTERTRTSTESAESVDTGRRDRAAEALRLIRESPIVGVGIGRYGTALRTVEHGQLVHSHNPVLQIGAEAGTAAGVLTAVAMIAGLAWTLRQGAAAVVVMLLSAPFWIVDAYGVVFPVGVAIAGLWMAVIVVAARVRHDVDDTPQLEPALA